MFHIVDLNCECDNASLRLDGEKKYQGDTPKIALSKIGGGVVGNESCTHGPY